MLETLVLSIVAPAPESQELPESLLAIIRELETLDFKNEEPEIIAEPLQEEITDNTYKSSYTVSEAQEPEGNPYYEEPEEVEYRTDAQVDNEKEIIHNVEEQIKEKKYASMLNGMLPEKPDDEAVKLWKFVNYARVFVMYEWG